MATFLQFEINNAFCFSKGPPKYFKSVLKKGDKVNFPKKGENVSCWYTGTLEDGTVFDTNIPTSRPHMHTSIRVGYCGEPCQISWKGSYPPPLTHSRQEEEADQAIELQDWLGPGHPRGKRSDWLPWSCNRSLTKAWL